MTPLMITIILAMHFSVTSIIIQMIPKSIKFYPSITKTILINVGLLLKTIMMIFLKMTV